jgi:hypothetical protein
MSKAQREEIWREFVHTGMVGSGRRGGYSAATPGGLGRARSNRGRLDPSLGYVWDPVTRHFVQTRPQTVFY